MPRPVRRPCHTGVPWSRFGLLAPSLRAGHRVGFARNHQLRSSRQGISVRSGNVDVCAHGRPVVQQQGRRRRSRVVGIGRRPRQFAAEGRFRRPTTSRCSRDQDCVRDISICNVNAYKPVDDLKAQEQLDGSDAHSSFIPLFRISQQGRRGGLR